MDAGVPRSCRDQQAEIAHRAPHGKDQHVPFRLLHLINFRALDLRAKLLTQSLKANGVKRHAQSSMIWEKSSLMRSFLPSRYSQPNRASRPVAL